MPVIKVDNHDGKDRPGRDTIRRAWITVSSGLPLLPRSPRPRVTVTDGVTIRVVSANLERGQRDAAGQAAALAALDADLLLCCEHTATTRAALTAAGFDAAYPHQADDPTDGYFGSLVASRHPIAAKRVTDIGGRRGQVVDVVAHGVTVRAVPVHTQAPIWDRDVDVWHSTIEANAAVTMDTAGPVVLAGDWNATGGHRRFRGALARHDLVDASAVAGRRWFPTWPVDLPLLGLRPPPFLTLDHVVVSSTVEVLGVETLGIPGSDHLALWALLRLPRR